MTNDETLTCGVCERIDHPENYVECDTCGGLFCYSPATSSCGELQQHSNGTSSTCQVCIEDPQEHAHNSSEDYVCSREHVEWLNGELERLVGDYVSMLGLIADIRFACGDNGLRMQGELVEYVRELKQKADMYDKEDETCGWYH